MSQYILNLRNDNEMSIFANLLVLYTQFKTQLI